MVSELTPASPSSHPGNVPGHPTFTKLSLPQAAPAAAGDCGDTVTHKHNKLHRCQTLISTQLAVCVCGCSLCWRLHS